MIETRPIETVYSDTTRTEQTLDTLRHTRERPSQNMFMFEVFTRFPE